MNAGSNRTSIRDALYEAPGPRTRRRMYVATSISAVLVLLGIAAIVRQFYVTGQLAPRYWTFLGRPTTWSFLLQGFRCVCCQFNLSNFLRHESGGFGQLRESRFPPKLMSQAFSHAVKCLSLLPDDTSDFYCTIVPQKTPNLTSNFGYGIGGKTGSIVKVKALHCF